VEPLPEGVSAYTDTAMRVLATETGGPAVGLGAAIVYGLLLLSAGNTAIMAIVAVLYSMAHDRELPSAFTKLNYPGVPWVGLIAACIAPVLVLMIFGSEVKTLAELYAVGVCGAITISILSCAWNRRLEIKSWERACLAVIGLVIFAIEATIIADKPHARNFALVLVVAVLGARYLVHLRRGAVPAPFPEPKTGWLAEIQREPAALDPAKPRIMLAARGRQQAEFAVDLAKKRGATLFAIYVRTLRLIDITPGAIPRVEDDPNALEALGSAAVLAREQGVPFVPIYVTSTDIADEILDYTVTFACDMLILGKSGRRAFWRKVEGDVVAKVATNLPREVTLVLRDPESDSRREFPVSPPPTSSGDGQARDGRAEGGGTPDLSDARGTPVNPAADAPSGAPGPRSE
jgi:nucleotide-binding universal stress UspA family protein